MLNRLSADEVPDEGREIIPCSLHREIDPSAADCCLDLSPRSDYARVLKESRHIRFAKTRDLFWIEVLERLAKRFALATVVLRNAPLFVVVHAEERVALRPGTTAYRL